jgi:hypothetical protein
MDTPMGPRERRNMVLTPAKKAMIMAFRQRTLLPLDNIVGCLRDASKNAGSSGRSAPSYGAEGITHSFEDILLLRRQQAPDGAFGNAR